MKALLFLWMGFLGLYLILESRDAGREHGTAESGTSATLDILPRTQRVHARALLARSPAVGQSVSAYSRSIEPLLQEHQSAVGSEAMDRAVESVPIPESAAVLDRLTVESTPLAAEITQLLLRRWAESEPEAAAAWTASLPEGISARSGIEQVTIAWASQDLGAAAAFVRALGEGPTKRAAIIALAYEAARTEPKTALELARDLPASPERDDLLIHAFSQWAGVDAPSATEWSIKVLDPRLRQRLLATAAVGGAEQNPIASARLAAGALEAGPEQNRAAVSVVERWAQQSPEAAAAWVSQFPAGPSRDQAIQNLLRIWSTKDPEAARNWIRSSDALSRPGGSQD
ncbi:MAG TPA: hypothetical protein VMZ27_04910 [Candidatus Saccharimonadales bacterium]|nr:hypothetical protein [Candidatus Saccharimonadales bacterium]